ncbi:hypothetical protein [Thioclava sp.]|uniref:hypothetical protein n=1 Tax=Thioclava sp. TaxID=1933450 RepID=UPI003AA84CA7
MVAKNFKLQKRAGKAEYSGRRRSATRLSGFKSHDEATGGKLQRVDALVFKASPDTPLELSFLMPDIDPERFAAFGFYFRANSQISLTCDQKWFGSRHYSNYGSAESFNKCGHIWQKEKHTEFTVSLTPNGPCEIEIFEPKCGEIWHQFFEETRDSVLRNIHLFAPEANFYTTEGKVEISGDPEIREKCLITKECNRCARFLPVNLPSERNTLSFSNHCVAKRPCRHRGFGILTDLDHGRDVELEYGFQLECRFCKKFVVNAALNPQRSADQMKEDAQRRRHFELMISELGNNSAQMKFRHETGQELATFIWEQFEKKCFKCKELLANRKRMHLDHTRPLALLWPLDETATALCGSCNSKKRDRQPKDFYTSQELVELSGLTGIPLDQLENPTPNLDVLKALLAKPKWLFDDFLNKEYLMEEKDGKVPAELICKSLDRVLQISKLDAGGFSFVMAWNNHFLE